MERNMYALGEPRDIRWLRRVINNWPFPRGKGIFLRLFESKLNSRNFYFEVEKGILVPGTLKDYVTRWAFVNGYGNQAEVRLSRLLVGQGATIIDVGANIGLWVMGAASIAGHDGNIHAFEPHPENYVQLRSNLALNGLEFVSCQQTALSDSPGRGLIYGASNGNCGMASLAKRDGVDEPIEVKITTLDSYCNNNGISKVDFIKVDVEGAELQVFSGAEHILESCDGPVIMFEVGDAMAESFGSSSSKVKSLLGKHGYSFYRCRGKQLESTPPDERHTQEDLFAFKAYHFERFPFLNSMM